MAKEISQEEIVSREIAILQIEIIDIIRKRLAKEDLGVDELVEIITKLDSMAIEESYEFD